jgi:thioredoxin 1
VAKPVAVTDETFEQVVLGSDLPTLVDFWAIWCGPCKMIAPVLEEIADEQDGRLQVLKLDVDANAKSTLQYGVMNIPTLILFKGGQPVERLVGFMPKAKLMTKITPHLNSPTAI